MKGPHHGDFEGALWWVAVAEAVFVFMSVYLLTLIVYNTEKYERIICCLSTKSMTIALVIALLWDGDEAKYNASQMAIIIRLPCMGMSCESLIFIGYLQHLTP